MTQDISDGIPQTNQDTPTAKSNSCSGGVREDNHTHAHATTNRLEAPEEMRLPTYEELAERYIKLLEAPEEMRLPTYEELAERYIKLVLKHAALNLKAEGLAVAGLELIDAQNRAESQMPATIAKVLREYGCSTPDSVEITNSIVAALSKL